LGGSGGGSGGSSTPSFFGGSGGGAILLNVAGSLVCQGRISADGLSGNGVGSGGGAGGTVALTVGTLSGTGTISANGGAGNGYGGGGGGGRIAIVYQTNAFGGIMTAFGGGGFAYGGAGTVFTKGNKAAAPAIGLLTLDNGGHFGTNTPLAQVGIVDLILGNGAVGYPLNGYLLLSNLTVNAGGTLTTLPQQTNLDVAVLGEALIAGTGAVTSDGKGYAQSLGPGAGLSTNNIGSGGGYGGIGGASSLLPGGITYGSDQQPADRGSGGGSGYPGHSLVGGGSEGGGAIRLSVARTFTINGRLSANGNPAFQEDGGGGAGGSIWITANSISGAGFVTTDGGSGELYQGGGGGGGRIALYAHTNIFAGHLSAFGGAGFDPGLDGSIYLSTNVSAPTVIAQTPTGVVSNGISFVDVFFNADINPNSVSASDISITTPIGLLSQNGIVASVIGLSGLRISFPFQINPGTYSIDVGPQIEDLLGQPMAQAYTGAFTISVPVIQGTVTDTNGQPVGGVLIQTDVGSTGSTDINGQYAIGVSPGASVTVTPSSTVVIFVPRSRSYVNVVNSVSNQNFIAVLTIAPALASSVQGTNIVINWFGLSGATYQTFYSINLIDWFPYSVALPGTNGPMQLLLPIDTDPAKFFRLRANN